MRCGGRITSCMRSFSMLALMMRHPCVSMHMCPTERMFCRDCVLDAAACAEEMESAQKNGLPAVDMASITCRSAIDMHGKRLAAIRASWVCPGEHAPRKMQGNNIVGSKQTSAPVARFRTVDLPLQPFFAFQPVNWANKTLSTQ